MTWRLIGYFPKRRTLRPDWMLSWTKLPGTDSSDSKTVEEICSASKCLAPGPERWREHGLHNVYDMYASSDVAWSIIPEADRLNFQMFAYRLLLVEFLDGKEEPMEDWSEPTVERISKAFVRLGWDAIVGGNHRGFGCSPLSCNAGLDVVRIVKKNRYCLMDTESEGINLARHFSICQPEPGPYCVLEVWRDTGSSAGASTSNT